MSEAELKRLLGWVYQRSRIGCFSKIRSERDQALADINFHLSKFRDDYVPVTKDPRSTWCGDSP